MTTPSAQSQEPTLALPTRRMLLAIAAASVATVLGWAALGWTAVASVAMPQREVLVAGASGAAVVAAVSITGVLVIRPWRTRAVSAWTTAWLAAMVLRLVVTPAVAYVLYSATALSLTPLMLSVAVTYVIVQVSEAAAVALYLKRVTCMRFPTGVSADALFRRR
jgi:hypothetical protein